MRVRPVQILVALFLFAFLLSPAQGGVPTDDSDWELKEEKNGIRIYSRSIEGSSINAFRAETTLDAPLENVMAVMSEPGSCVEWVHQCSESFGLPEGTFNERYAYSVNSMPWPARDRDYVLKIKTESNPDSDTVVMNMSAVEGKKPEKSGHVRINHSYTVYEFRRTDDERTHMTWYQHTEPGGALPSWLVNRLATDLPYNSMRELNRILQEGRYQDHKIKYDESGEIVDVLPPDPENGEPASEAISQGGSNGNQ